MNLKGLVHREIDEGMTEKELAAAVGVSVQTITDILTDNLFMQTPCDSEVRHTQMDCSTSQKAPIIPPSAHCLGTVISWLVSEGAGLVGGATTRFVEGQLTFLMK